MKIKVDIDEQNLKSAIAPGIFDEAYRLIQREGYRIISASEKAQLRMDRGVYVYHNIIQHGDWVNEDFVYNTDKKVYLTKNSPINRNARDAVVMHLEGKEFYLSSEELNFALQGALLLSEKQIDVPTNRFGSDDRTVFMFGEKVAGHYGAFLDNLGVKSIQVKPLFNYHLQGKSKPFARKCRMRGVYRGSSLEGYRMLPEHNCVRGIQELEAG